MTDVKGLDAQHVLQTYRRLPVVFERGEGVWLIADTGRRYLDFVSGIGVAALGHAHPAIARAVSDQAATLLHTSNVYFHPLQGELAARLASLTGLDRTFFCNSGTEAVEGALKLARLYTGRHGFVSTHNAFHGKSLGSLSVTGRPVFREPFQPLLQDVTFVPYGDASSMEGAITRDTAAVILEPVQGEGGVIVPPDDYLPAVREACTRQGALLIADEVQTGLGRVGALFGVNLSGVVPDILCLAKALSGGVIPCGSFTTTDEIFASFHRNPMFHSSTFGNNPLAATAAAKAIEITVRDRLPERSARLGAALLERLRRLQRKHPDKVCAVRGRGLLLGIEMRDQDLGGALAGSLFERRILVAYALNRPEVIRIEPPLNIPEPYLDRLVEALEASIASL
jgi:putrescine aminotransferase